MGYLATGTLIISFPHDIEIDPSYLQEMVKTAVDLVPWRGGNAKSTGAVEIQPPFRYRKISPWHAERWQYWATVITTTDWVSPSQIRAFDRFCQAVGNRFKDRGFDHHVHLGINVTFESRTSIG